MKRSQLICLILTYLTILGVAYPQSQLRDLKRKYNKFNRFHKRIERLEAKSSADKVDRTVSITPFVPEGGTLGRLEKLYHFMHPQELITLPEDPKVEGYYTDGYGRYFVNYGKPILDGTMEVMAWHPWWNDINVKTYSMDLVSMISYYAYDIGEEGYPRDLEFQMRDRLKPFLEVVRDTTLVLRPKVLLTIASLDAKQTTEFLMSSLAQQHLFNELHHLDSVFDNADGELGTHGLDGIDVQLDGLQGAALPYFHTFIKDLHSRLQDFVENPVITVSIPPLVVGQGMPDFSVIDPYVDFFILSGSQLIPKSSLGNKAPAPLFPAARGQPSIDDSFWRYAENGVDWRKLIVAFPLMGTSWSRGTFNDFEHPEFIYEKVQDVSQIVYDPVSTSMKFVSDDRITYWFENEMSLNAKFRWATSSQAAGVGLWTLGFVSSYGEVWGALEQNFSDSLVAIDRSELEIDKGQLYGFVEKLDKHRYEVGAGLIIIMAFMVLGLFLSLFDFRVRRMLFENQYFRAVFLVAAGIISQVIILIFIRQFDIPTGWPLWIIVSLAGGYLGYWILKKFVVYRRELP